AAAAGRSLGELDLTLEVKVSFDPDPVRARENTRFWSALGLPAEQKVGVDDPLELQRLADALPLARAARRWIVSDRLDVHVDRARAYLDIGFRHLVFHAAGRHQDRFLKAYGDEVLPQLRSWRSSGQ